MPKSPYNNTRISNTYVKAKMTKYFGFAAEIKEFFKLPRYIYMIKAMKR
jgi:hypothetical protein